MELSGRTEFLSLFDVAQVLCVNEASGLLRVQDSQAKGYLYFDGGAIINALDADRGEGEDAAKRVFAMRDASFSFSADLPSVAKRISCTTQSLMMDIARQLDEEAADGDAGGHVREALQATRTLHELFKRLDSESRTLSHCSVQGFAVSDLLGAIRDVPGSTLWLRAGCPPAVHVAGRRIPLSDVALDRAGFESLRDHLMRGVGPLDRLDGETDRLMRVGEDEAYRIQRLQNSELEILTVRRLSPVAAALREDLISRLAHPGTVTLFPSADPGHLEEIATTLAIELAARSLSPVLAFARRWPVELQNAHAPALFLDERCFPSAPEVIDRLAPRTIVVADSDVPGALTLALRGVRRGAGAIVGVCGPIDGACNRLLDAIGESERLSVTRELEWRLSGILINADGATELLPLDDAARAALRRTT